VRPRPRGRAGIRPRRTDGVTGDRLGRRGASRITDYDAIATQYRRAKRQPWRSVIESFTLMDLVGDLAGKTVVDLACGEGYYTRRLSKRGAERVVGVDLSEGMIALARAEEARRPLGIDYLVQDVRSVSLAAEFDLAVAAYLLNYARDREELGAMCRGIARCLGPGGRFVSVNSNPGLDPHVSPSYRAYGFETSAAGRLGEGTPITWTFHLGHDRFEIENYHLDVAAHEQALRSAGFREIRWHGPRLSPRGEAAWGRDYWAPFLAHPPVIFLECAK
jgi:toxoflavin synthase